MNYRLVKEKLANGLLINHSLSEFKYTNLMVDHHMTVTVSTDLAQQDDEDDFLKSSKGNTHPWILIEDN